MLWYEALAGALEPGDDAVFDADGTLWEGDVGEGFQARLVEEGVLPPTVEAEYRRLLAVDFAEAYVFGTRALAGLEERWLAERGARYFAEAFAARVYPEMRGLLARLAARGVTTWVASASNRWVVAPGAATLGVPAERVLAMAVEVEDGVLSDRVVPPPVTREGKAEAVLARLGRAPALAVGNSANDLPLLRLATKAGLVVNAAPRGAHDGSEELLAEAERRGWLVRELF